MKKVLGVIFIFGLIIGGFTLSSIKERKMVEEIRVIISKNYSHVESIKSELAELNTIYSSKWNINEENYKERLNPIKEKYDEINNSIDYIISNIQTLIEEYDLEDNNDLLEEVESKLESARNGIKNKQSNLSTALDSDKDIEVEAIVDQTNALLDIKRFYDVEYEYLKEGTNTLNELLKIYSEESTNNSQIILEDKSNDMKFPYAIMSSEAITEIDKIDEHLSNTSKNISENIKELVSISGSNDMIATSESFDKNIKYIDTEISSLENNILVETKVGKDYLGTVLQILSGCKERIISKQLITGENIASIGELTALDEDGKYLKTVLEQYQFLIDYLKTIDQEELLMVDNTTFEESDKDSITNMINYANEITDMINSEEPLIKNIEEKAREANSYIDGVVENIQNTQLKDIAGQIHDGFEDIILMCKRMYDYYDLENKSLVAEIKNLLDNSRNKITNAIDSFEQYNSNML